MDMFGIGCHGKRRKQLIKIRRRIDNSGNCAKKCMQEYICKYVCVYVQVRRPVSTIRSMQEAILLLLLFVMRSLIGIGCGCVA